MELRLSIIIPFFNVERYISECLDSVFDQDIPLSDYEVICVNDGSPDNSRDIVLDYMTRFQNLRLIEHEQNKKLGAARNTGRSVATGNYIWNVDSDDRIVPNCLGEVLKICEAQDLDVLEFGAFQFYNDNYRIMEHVPEVVETLAGLDYLCTLTPYQVSRMCPVWRKVIRREFLEENCIYSPEINMGEDIPYSFKLLMLAKRMQVSSSPFYLYRENQNSLTGANWEATAEKLYEKCFIDSKLIIEVASAVPPSYPSVRHSFMESAKYTINLYRRFYDSMSHKEQLRFKRICRDSFIKDRPLLSLMSKRALMKHFLLLCGIQ